MLLTLELIEAKQFPKINKNYIQWKNLINPIKKIKNKRYLELKPFETMWLSNI